MKNITLNVVTITSLFDSAVLRVIVTISSGFSVRHDTCTAKIFNAKSDENLSKSVEVINKYCRSFFRTRCVNKYRLLCQAIAIYTAVSCITYSTLKIK